MMTLHQVPRAAEHNALREPALTIAGLPEP